MTTRRQHGVIDMVRQPGYPDMQGQNGKETITVVYQHDPALPYALPEYGMAYYDEESLLGLVDLDYLTLSKRSVKRTSGGMLEITCVYTGDNPAYAESDRVISEEIELEGDEEDIPLEQLDNYRTRWNNRLLSKSPIVTGPEPPFFFTEKTTVIPESYREGWKWIKPGDQVPEGWYEYRSEYKPGVENKLGGTHTVVRTRRALSKYAFERDMANDLTITPPPDDFGLNGEWLRGITRIRKEGDYWVATNRYFNALTIDRDLYKVAGGATT